MTTKTTDLDISIGGSADQNFSYALDLFREYVGGMTPGDSVLRRHAQRVTISAGPRGAVIECNVELFHALVPEGFTVRVSMESLDSRILNCQLPGGGLQVTCHQRVKRALVDGVVVEVWT